MNKRQAGAELRRLLKIELERIEKWHRRFLSMAELVGSWSKDPSTQVGAVIVDTETRYVLAVGYNGFPRGVNDLPERYSERDIKYSIVVHAEVNALLSSHATLTGATLYCSVGLPCPNCAGSIIQAGIKKVVIPSNPKQKPKKVKTGAVDLYALSQQMFEEAEVEVVEVEILHG